MLTRLFSGHPYFHISLKTQGNSNWLPNRMYVIEIKALNRDSATLVVAPASKSDKIDHQISRQEAILRANSVTLASSYRPARGPIADIESR